MPDKGYWLDSDMATVKAINDDGTIDVNVANRPHDFEIGVQSSGIFLVGDRIQIGYYEQNRDLPFVKWKGSHQAAGLETSTVPISSLNWDSWRNGLYRGGWNNTNIHPDLALAEITLCQYTDDPPIQSLSCSKIHAGYVYVVEHYEANYHKVWRLNLAVGSVREYTTGGEDWNGVSGNRMLNGPEDMVILVEIENEIPILYLYIYWSWSVYHFITKYNLTTMAWVYRNYWRDDKNNQRRFFYDATYLYRGQDASGNSGPVEGLHAFHRSTGAYASFGYFAWPVFDKQINDTDHGDVHYLPYESDLRALLEPRQAGSIFLPQILFSQVSSGETTYQVPAFNLDGTMKWDYVPLNTPPDDPYVPISKQLTKAYQAYCLYWYAYSYFDGAEWEQVYSNANQFYNFGDIITGDKQIRNTLIACNDALPIALAIVLCEETTIKNNTAWYSYDDWQQTVWAAQEWPAYSGFVRRYVADGVGAPGMDHADFAAMRDQVMGAYNTLALDATPLPFSWVDKKEVTLKILNVNTGELLGEIKGSSYLADTGLAENDLTIPGDQLIQSIRACSHTINIARTTTDMTPYTGPLFEEFMGIAEGEEVRNCMRICKIDVWEPDYDPETPYEYYWCGAMLFGGFSLAPGQQDQIAKEFDGYSVSISDVDFWDSIPYNCGRWDYRCVAVTHPDTQVFHTSIYVPTGYDWTKTLMTNDGTTDYLIVAPSGDSGMLGCFQITGTPAWKWNLNVGPGSNFQHFCCTKDRVYYFRKTIAPEPIVTTLYEINLLTGAIITTKTGVAVCANDGTHEPMVIDNKIVLPNLRAISYLGI